MGWDITWGVSGSYTLPVGDEPDWPIRSMKMDGGDYLRANNGALYNPSRYKYNVYYFTFTGITVATADQFAELFEDEDSFTIENSGFGTVEVVPSPGTLMISYISKDNCNLSFTVEQKTAT